jgi:glucose-6-phosphate isomerase
MDLFFFVPALESLGKWARQLVAESIGKEFDRDGRTIHNGITPTVSIGSVDLHSVAQLNFGGPKDKWTMLVSARSHELKEKASGWSKLADIPEVSPGEVFDAILAGTRAAYAKRDLPLLHVELSSVSPYTIGAWMAWFMIATYISSEIMNLNAFDQPAVEDYKRATREHLSHHKQ